MNKIPTPEDASKVAIKRRMYAIRDDKQREYQTPVIISNDAVASRTFGDMVNQNKESPMYRHAGDFSLWYLGDFNVETGAFVNATDGVYIVCRASDFVEV